MNSELLKLSAKQVLDEFENFGKLEANKQTDDGENQLSGAVDSHGITSLLSAAALTGGDSLFYGSFFSRCFGRCLFGSGLALGRCLGWGRGVATALRRDGTDQTLGAGTDEIFPVSSQQGLANQIIILGVPVLNQCTLHCLFMW